MKGQEALNALWEALEEDRKPPPPLSITAYDYVDKFNVTYSSAVNHLKRKVESKDLECATFYCAKRQRPTKFYWQPKKGAK